MPDGTYSLPDLCDLADVTPRTVRYYISQGLLRSPGTTGPGARYDDGHLARLRLIRRLQREHLPLAEIRARLAALTDDEAIAQAEGPAEPPTDSALDYVRGVLGGGAMRSPKPSSPTPSSQAPSAPPAARSTPPSPLAASAAPGLREPATTRRWAGLRSIDSATPEPSAAAPAGAGPPTVETTIAERSQWERFVLAPDVELHVRRPLTRSQNRAVARLLEVARRLLEEDQP